MSVRPSGLPPVQDMPPPGGFKPIDTVRAFPKRGPQGWQLWAGATLAIMYGFHTVGVANHKRAEQKLEDRRIRYAIAPLLQVEAYQAYMKNQEAMVQYEKEVMKDVEGWKPSSSPFFSKKFMPRAVDPLNKSAY